MEEEQRYKIDLRNEDEVVVWVNRHATSHDLAEVMPEIEARLADYWTEQRRRPVMPVAELVGDEAFLAAATGTEGVSELVARQRRLTFGLVP